MSQTASSGPFGFAKLVETVLGDIAEAIAAREPTPARKAARVEGVLAMAMGLFPANVMQMMLAGQAVMFHVLTTDATRELLADPSAVPSVKARAGIANLGRTVTKNLETLIRLQGPAAQGWLTPPVEDQAPPPVEVEPPPAEPPIAPSTDEAEETIIAAMETALSTISQLLNGESAANEPAPAPAGPPPL